MAYTPDATDGANPLNTTDRSTAAAEFRALKTYLQEQLTLLKGELTVQPGTILPFAGGSVPAGYLACPAVVTNISRVTYAALFAAIGTYWGAGDGATTFGMPYFPAGYAAVVGTPGVATVGEVISHTHTTNATAAIIGGAVFSGANGHIDPGVIDPTGGPANLAAGMGVMMIVKT